MSTEAPNYPKVGDNAPDFSLPSTEGGQMSLADHRDQRSVVLYFYAKDDSPGCTTEACAFRDLRGQFQAKGAEIVGVSTDSIKSHESFQTKHGFNFPLLSDEDHSVAERYGVWQLRNFAGREFMGVNRTTFVIGKDGKIKAVFPNVKVEGHADKVLDAVE